MKNIIIFICILIVIILFFIYFKDFKEYFKEDFEDLKEDLKKDIQEYIDLIDKIKIERKNQIPVYYINMDKDIEKKPNPLAKVLADKKAKQFNQNFNNTKGPKPSKGFGGNNIIRRTARGR